MESGKDKAAELKKILGANLSLSQNIDHTVVQSHVDSGFGMEQLAIMAIGVAVVIMAQGAGAELLAGAMDTTLALCQPPRSRWPTRPSPAWRQVR